MLTLPQIILKNLLSNDDFCKKALPFVKEEYFEDSVEKQIYKKIHGFYTKFNSLPTTTSIILELDQDTNITEDQYKKAGDILDNISNCNTKENEDWLTEQTEKFCKERAMVNAIMESIGVMEDIKGNKGNKQIAYIEDLVRGALSVSFDPKLGHDFFGDSDQRFLSYHKVLDRLPFDLVKFNDVTNGGLPKKTLSVIIAGTNVGKSLCMCHFSAAALAIGKKVLYISLEMAEEEVAKRIDANLLDISLDDLKAVPDSTYKSRMKKLKSKTLGELRIKEYVAGNAHVGHFRHLLNELKLTKSFVPDLICVDYITICASSRVKMNGSGMNSNSFYKMVTEELRGLGQEFNIPIISAAQLNRTGFGSSDPGLDNIAEAFSIAQTADWAIIVTTNEDLEAKGQYMVKQVKSRLSDATKKSKFFIGVDRSKQRLFDIANTDDTDGTSDSIDIPPPFTTNNSFRKSGKKDFSSFNFGN